MKTTLVITEKKSISASIARALRPDLFDDRGSCDSLHTDIFTLRDKFVPIKSLDDIRCHALHYTHGDDSLKRLLYYCQQDCTRCGFELQHMDHMGARSAGRARKRIKNINEHYVSRIDSPLLTALLEADKPLDLDELCEALSEHDSIQTDNRELNHSEFTLAVQRMIDRLLNSRKPYISCVSDIFELTPEGRRAASSDRANKTIPEELSYYAFTRNGEAIIIADTNGTPYSVKARETHPYGLITAAKDWNEVQRNLWLFASVDSRDQHDLKSHLARAWFFNHILVKRKLPCNINGTKTGSDVELNRVIAATDYDVAGSYIILSVLEAAQERWNSNSAVVNPAQVKRMKLQSLEPKSLAAEFDKPIDFDWQNAYAGKARSTFDFMFGSALTNRLKYVSEPKKARFSMSVGRVRFLALKKLIQAEMQIRESKPARVLYITFPGLVDLDSIKTHLAEGTFSALQLQQHLAGVSFPLFMKLCERDNIGTHTTRYKEPQKLEQHKLAVTFDGTHITSTPFGNAFFHALAPIIDSPYAFSISAWNRQLAQVIEDWAKKEDVDQKAAKAMYDTFMSRCFPAVKECLKYAGRNMHALIDTLIRQYAALPNIGIAKAEKKKIMPGPFQIIGDDGLLRPEDIFKIFNSNSNSPRAGSFAISRGYDRQFQSIEDPIRCVCNIGLEYEFMVERCYNIDEMLGYGNEDHTVFRAIVDSADGIVEVLKAVPRISTYREMQIDIDGVLNAKDNESHEPLQMTSVSPADIAGEKGMWLVDEYMLPWRATKDKIDKKTQGKVNVASLDIGGITFERSERYEFGLVHNFETLLTAMLEKYRMPFIQTARMAEELYLNVR